MAILAKAVWPYGHIGQGRQACWPYRPRPNGRLWPFGHFGISPNSGSPTPRKSLGDFRNCDFGIPRNRISEIRNGDFGRIPKSVTPILRCFFGAYWPEMWPFGQYGQIGPIGPGPEGHRPDRAGQSPEMGQIWVRRTHIWVRNGPISGSKDPEYGSQI